MLAHIVKKSFFVVLFLSLFFAVAFGFALAQESPDPPLTPHQRWTEAVFADLDRYQHPPDYLPRVHGNPARVIPPRAPSDIDEDHRMVYQSYLNGNWDIYYVSDYQSPPLTLARTSSSEIHPRLNRGATRIVFTSDRDDNYELFLINPDGSELAQLTSNESDDVNPYWSPDGGKIVFESYRDGQPEIYVMNVDGSNQTRLSFHPSYDGTPFWSVDGQHIYFTSYRDGYYQIYSMNADGSGLKRLATGSHSLYPALSPDGSVIAFSGDGDGNGWLDLWTIDVDGSNAMLRKYGGSMRDLWVRGWFGNAPQQSVVGTEIDFVYYKGDLYWEVATGFEYILGGGKFPIYNGSPYAWNHDVVSIDIVAPNFHPFTVPEYSRREVEVYWQQATDIGGSLTYGYDIHIQEYPDDAWKVLHAQTSSSSIHEPFPGGKTYRFRVRAIDGAYNYSDWFYTNPTTVYSWMLDSFVTDNRGNPLSDVTVSTDPATFLTLRRNDIYRNYVGELGSPFSVQWSLDGYSQLPDTSYGEYSVDSTIAVALPPQNNLISDGGFESGGWEEWNVNKPDYVSVKGSDVHTGIRHLFFSHETTLELAISQTITIPVNMPYPTLSFFYRLDEDSSGGDAGLEVELAWDQSAQTIFTASSVTEGWQHAWKDLSSWAGESVKLTFRRTAGDAIFTSLDDISLGSTSPDLWLANSGALTALPGETVVRTIHYGNRGGVGAPGTGLTLTLPAELTLVSASPAPTSRDPLHWDLGDIPAGESGSIVLTLTMSNTASMLDTATGQVDIATEYEAYTVNNGVDLAFLVGHRLLLPLFVRQ